MLPREYDTLGLPDLRNVVLERGEAIVIERGRARYLRVRRAS
jgi:hypothetical protein